jgi:hypothetical protein
MQQRSQSQQQVSQGAGYLVVALAEGLARATALTVEVFLHKGFGSRYVGCGLMGIVIIFVFARFFADQNVFPLYCYMAAYGVLWLIATINMLIRFIRREETVHSRYPGRPLLWSILLPNWKETSFRQLEALAVILLGYGVHYLNRPLGDYLMLAASFVFLRGYGFAVQQRDRAIAMNDAVIEQKLVAEKFRDMQER